MAEQFYTILTNVGKAKIANAVALGNTVQITQIAVGDGGGNYYNPSETQTALINEVWRGNVSRVDTDPNNPNWVIVEAVIPPDQGGFYIREVGVFDADGDLIAIGKYPETYKPTFTNNNAGKDLVIRCILEVSNASAVELKVDPTTVTVQAVNDKIAQHNTDTTSHQDLRNAIADLQSNKAAIADFTSSLMTSGYQKLVSGLVIQWGEGLTTTDANGYATFTFPIAFPNACFQVVCVDLGGAAVDYGVISMTATDFTVVVRDSNGTLWANNGIGIRFIAVGY